jgi:hypothetical protein
VENPWITSGKVLNYLKCGRYEMLIASMMMAELPHLVPGAHVCFTQFLKSVFRLGFIQY